VLPLVTFEPDMSRPATTAPLTRRDPHCGTSTESSGVGLPEFGVVLVFSVMSLDGSGICEARCCVLRSSRMREVRSAGVSVR
jgi:hypothetical protein